MVRYFSLLQNVQTGSGTHPVTWGPFLWGEAALDMKLTTYLSLSLRLQMCGAIPPISLCVFMTFTGTALFWHLFMNMEVLKWCSYFVHLTKSTYNYPCVFILVTFFLACRYANFLPLLFVVNTNTLNIPRHHTAFIRRVNGIRPFRRWCQIFIHFSFIIMFSFVNYIGTHLLVFFYINIVLCFSQSMNKCFRNLWVLNKKIWHRSLLVL
jgi:hypothetical protein